jgi:two-component system chemotaxis response regulator CheB
VHKILIVDDSKFFQNFLKGILLEYDDYEIEFASDPYEARDKIKQNDPDLVTVDINMPKMDGISFIKNLLRLHPMPILLISSYIDDNNIEFLKFNHIPTIKKQSGNESINEFREKVIRKIKLLEFEINRYKKSRIKTQEPKTEPTIIPKAHKEYNNNLIEVKYKPDDILLSSPNHLPKDKLIAIGSSTGGVEALTEILQKLPLGLPPILIVQHIPKTFSTSLAHRLDSLSNITVYEAEDGMRLSRSCAYLSPGDMHLTIEKDNDSYKVHLIDGVKVSRHKPSVDVLFRSVNNIIGGSAMGIILTGMGDDGVIGLKEMYLNNAYTIAQDKDSCVVFGMPARAIENGAISKVMPLKEIAQEIVKYAHKGGN